MEFLLYGYIGSYSATEFINSLSNTTDDELTIRINSEGGEPGQSFGMIAKLKDYPGSKKIKVDGGAYSMAAFMCLYATDVEALDVSNFMFHRAGYPDWFEKAYLTEGAESFSPGLLKNLNTVNASLKKAFESKINIEAFEKIAGFTVDEMFSMSDRKEIFFDAKQAKKIGLVSSINQITPEKQIEINAQFNKIAANFLGFPKNTIDATIEQQKGNKAKNNKNNQKNKKMTVEDLKRENPEAFSALVNEIKSQERDRVNAWLTYSDVDADSVKKGIESGEPISQTATADFMKKIASKNVVNEIEKTAPETAETEETTIEASADQNAVSDFAAKVSAELNPAKK